MLSDKPGRTGRPWPGGEPGFSDSPELIDKPGVARLIPHAGAMCLLDGVLSWDEERIRCASITHQAPDNPLRNDGRLGTLCGIEYAAQAIAVHGALVDGETSRPGKVPVAYLASLRALACHADRLDLFPGPLIIEAERLHADAGRAIYSFALRHADRILLEGRAAVVLAAGES